MDTPIYEQLAEEFAAAERARAAEVRPSPRRRAPEFGASAPADAAPSTGPVKASSNDVPERAH